METFDSDQQFAVGLDSIERVLELDGRDVTEVAMETLRIRTAAAFYSLE